MQLGIATFVFRTIWALNKYGRNIRTVSQWSYAFAIKTICDVHVEIWQSLEQTKIWIVNAEAIAA